MMTTVATSAPRVLVPLQLEPQAAPALGACLHVLDGATMGTTWQVRIVAAAGAPTEPWRHAIEAELDRVIVQMSTWLAASQLCRFNAAPAGSWHSLPAEFRAVLDCALTVARHSGGAFDPAAGALVDLWGFGPGPRFDAVGFVPPDAAACAQARAQGGWQRLVFDGQRLCQPGGLKLDFSAIAKGYAVDRVALALRGLGLAHCLVEVGGELRGHGLRPDGQPWWVELESVPSATLPVTRVALHGLSVATSGDYRRFFTNTAGQRRSHTIDPRDGQPVRHGLASVSVIHAECVWADAWSTALTVLGPDAGPALAREHGLAALFVRRRGDAFEEIATPALQELAL